MNKNNKEYYLQKEKNLHISGERLRNSNLKYFEFIEKNKDIYKTKIKNFIISFFKLKNYKKYTIEYSLTNVINIYYHLSSQQNDKRKVLEIRFIYDKERKNIVDFFITPLKDESKEESILENLVFIGKIAKFLLKKDLFLSKYNKLFNKFKNKQLLLKTKIIKNSNIFQFKILPKQEKLQYQYLKYNILKKKIHYHDNALKVDIPFFPFKINYPLSIKVNLLKEKKYKYKITIKTRKESNDKDLICNIDEKLFRKTLILLSKSGGFKYL